MNDWDVISTLSTSCISDAMDKLGLDGGCEALRPVAPRMRCVGEAYTIEFEQLGEGETGPAADYIDDVPPGAVIAIDNGGRRDCTVWGDILTFVARARGVAGTVIDGCCRDTTTIIDLGYPVFSVSSYMKSGKNRVRMVSTQQPIRLAGTEVRSGDIVVGDDSGVLVVPRAALADVARTACEVQRMEEEVMKDVSGGMPLRSSRELRGYNRFSFQRQPG